MAVRIRLKRMGRRHRPFFRVCAMDSRSPRDGKVIEELGHYDPMVKETDARAILNGERIDHWLGNGAQPTDKVRVLIKKYGTNGTHLEQQKQALEKLSIKPVAPPPQKIELPVEEPETKPQAAAEETPTEGGGPAPEGATEAPAEEAAASETEEKSE